jgi:hypothetical protein
MVQEAELVARAERVAVVRVLLMIQQTALPVQQILAAVALAALTVEVARMVGLAL